MKEVKEPAETFISLDETYEHINNVPDYPHSKTNPSLGEHRAYENLKSRGPIQHIEVQAPIVEKMTKYEKTAVALLVIILALVVAVVAMAAAILALTVKDSTSYVTSTPPSGLTTTACPAPVIRSTLSDNNNCFINLRSYGLNYNDNGTDGGLHCWIQVNGTTFFNAVFTLFQAIEERGRGVNTMVLDTSSCTASSLNHFDTFGYSGAATNLSNYVTNLEDGVVLLGVTCDEPVASLAAAYDTLDSVGITVRDVGVRGMFAFVMEKGRPLQTILAKSGGDVHAAVAAGGTWGRGSGLLLKVYV